MRNALIYIAMAVLLAACGHRASQGDTAGGDSLAVGTALTTDSIHLQRGDSMVSISISVEWPVGGGDSLVRAVRHYICEQLANGYAQEGQPEVRLYDDGKEAVQAVADTLYRKLEGQWREAHESGYPTDMPFSFYMKVSKQEDNGRYVTYLSRHEGFQGGAHGYASSSEQTFRSRDGLRIGYEVVYNREKEAFERKGQNLFRDTDSPQLAALIKEGVCGYFREAGDTLTTDEELKELLIGVDDVNRIPLPSAAPSLTRKGLLFVYQQYEIAPYAAGMINFTIPYQQILPCMTPEAAELIK